MSTSHYLTMYGNDAGGSTRSRPGEDKDVDPHSIALDPSRKSEFAASKVKSTKVTTRRGPVSQAGTVMTTRTKITKTKSFKEVGADVDPDTIKWTDSDADSTTFATSMSGTSKATSVGRLQPPSTRTPRRSLKAMNFPPTPSSYRSGVVYQGSEKLPSSCPPSSDHEEDPTEHAPSANEADEVESFTKASSCPPSTDHGASVSHVAAEEDEVITKKSSKSVHTQKSGHGTSTKTKTVKESMKSSGGQKSEKSVKSFKSKSVKSIAHASEPPAKSHKSCGSAPSAKKSSAKSTAKSSAKSVKSSVKSSVKTAKSSAKSAKSSAKCSEKSGGFAKSASKSKGSSKAKSLSMKAAEAEEDDSYMTPSEETPSLSTDITDERMQAKAPSASAKSGKSEHKPCKPCGGCQPTNIKVIVMPSEGSCEDGCGSKKKATNYHAEETWTAFTETTEPTTMTTDWASITTPSGFTKSEATESTWNPRSMKSATTWKTGGQSSRRSSLKDDGDIRSRRSSWK